ncbi:MAG: potassium channel family protein [Pirellulaceae bacterium]
MSSPSLRTRSRPFLIFRRPASRFCARIEGETVIVFTSEYLLRLWSAPVRFSTLQASSALSTWPRSSLSGSQPASISDMHVFYGCCDCFRILKLTRYNRAMQRFHKAMLLAREEIVIYLCLTSMLLFIAAAGIYHFEHEAQPEQFSSIFASLWWALATLTTVGYGDVYPITIGGRCFTAIMLMLGLGIVAVPAGLVASTLATAREMELLSHANADHHEEYDSDGASPDHPSDPDKAQPPQQNDDI